MAQFQKFIFAVLLFTFAPALQINHLLETHLSLGATANAAIPSDLDPVKLQAVIDRAVAQGEPMETSDGVYLSLKNLQPNDPTQSHRADYFSAVGGFDSHGKFGVSRLEVVSENWVLNQEHNWEIDQWLFRSWPDGDLRLAMHIQLVETADGLLLSSDILKTTDEEGLKEWSSHLNGWYAPTN
jgi:hypothetical protein